MSIVNDVAEYIRQGETSSEDLGLEIEHFILNDKGMPIDFHRAYLYGRIPRRLSDRGIFSDA